MARGVKAPAQAEFAIITILEETYESIVRMCGLTEHDNREGYQWAYGSVDRRDGGGPVTVAMSSPLDRENLAAGSFADAMMRAWSPSSVILVDIGGGVAGRDGVELGDVVVHTQLHYYDFHKIDGDGDEEPRYTPLPGASTYLRELARRPSRRGDMAWLETIEVERPGDGSPKVLQGEMLSGGALLSKSERLDRLLAAHQKALVVEMEGPGVARAVLDSGLRGPQPEFLVVRGISDFCNDGQAANQSTREAWRRYAAEAAAAVACSILREADGDRAGSDGPTIPIPRPAKPTIPRSSQPKWGVKQDGMPRPFFEIGFEMEGREYNIANLGEAVHEQRRLALIGRAGAGKTFAVRRMQEAYEGTVPVIFIGQDGWARELDERLPAFNLDGPRPDSWRRALDTLLRSATEDITVDQLEAEVEQHSVVLAVDSLNSLPAPVATRVLDVLDEAVRQLRDLVVLVTDRSDARYPAPGRWTVATITKLDNYVSQRRIDERFSPGSWAKMSKPAQLMLASPFFLDLVLRGAGLESHTRSGALAKFIADHARLGPDAIEEVVVATAAAFADRKRDLPAAALADDTRAVLIEADLVTEHADSGRLTFTHELFGDYFASLHLVGQSGDWPSDELNAISFSGERWRFEGLSIDTDSFNAITLAAEMMPPDAGDSYLRAVYDWNWRAAVDCLGWTDPVDGPFSEAARLVVLALLSERRADPVDGTSRRAARLLAGLPDKMAKQLAVEPESRARSIIAGCEHDDVRWFEDWQRVFCRDADSPWSEDALQDICLPDTLFGWTVSYVLKRAPLSPQACIQLIGIYQGCRVDGREQMTLWASIRWRIVHSLAAGDGENVLDFLLAALDDDPYPWVRWGAARSLTEFAARSESPELAAKAIGALRERARELPVSVATEIAWVSQYRQAMPHFPGLMRPLLDVLRSNARGEVSRSQWDDRLKRFERFWDEANG